jgi:Zn-dependent protease
VADTQQTQPTGTRRSGLRLGSVGGVPIYVGATWLLVAGLITIGFQPFVRDRLPELGEGGAYLVSGSFALLLYGSVLLHELSHALTARRLGIGVRGITLHFLGGVTEMTEEPRTPGREVAVSASGPAVSLVVGIGAWALAAPFDRSVAELLLVQLAWANVVVGVFNLLPALPLDGGHLLQALVWRVTGDRGRGVVTAAWAGRVLAGLVALVPFLLAVRGEGGPSIVGILYALLIATFLWSGASQSLAVAAFRRRLPHLDAGALARPAAIVAADTPLAEAVRRAHGAGAGALVVADAAGWPRGLVSEAAVAATPEERRPWVSAGAVARTLAADLVLPATLTGEALVRRLQEAPASEYLVVAEDGRLVGVLATADVEAVLTAT